MSAMSARETRKIARHRDEKRAKRQLGWLHFRIRYEAKWGKSGYILSSRELYPEVRRALKSEGFRCEDTVAYGGVQISW